MSKFTSKEPKISVIMPVYNAQEFINESINSILTQTYSNFELFILNDGSTDLSEEIILSYRDQRIRYIKNQKNEGIVNTLNYGISLANGELIARMDADDVSAPQRFEKQVIYMNDNQHVDILGTETRRKGFPLIDNSAYKEIKYISETVHKINLLRFNTISHPTVMIRRNKLLESKLSYDKRCEFAEDYKLWAEASINDLKIHTISDKLLEYRHHKGQMSSIYTEKQRYLRAHIQLALGNFYFGDLIAGREFTYLKLMKRSELISEEDLVERRLLLYQLIDHNAKNHFFDQEIFVRILTSLIKSLKR